MRLLLARTLVITLTSLCFGLCQAAEAGEWSESHITKYRFTIATNAERYASSGLIDPEWSSTPRPWDDPITAEGKMQALDLGAALRHNLQPDAQRNLRVVCCPLLRTFQTAVAVAKQLSLPKVHLDLSICESLTKDIHGSSFQLDRANIFLSAKELSFYSEGLEVVTDTPMAPLPTDWENNNDTSRIFNIVKHIVYHASEMSGCIVVTTPSFALQLARTFILNATHPVAFTRNAARITISLHIEPSGDVKTHLESKYFKGVFRYTPNTDWFSRHIDHWTKFFLQSGRFDFTRKIEILEIGVYEGRSAVWLLENIISRHADSRIVLVDPIVENQLLRLKFNLRLTGEAHKATTITKFSLAAFDEIVLSNQRFDVVYIDGDHRACQALFDAILSFQVLKMGGYIIFDDYLWVDQEVTSVTHPKPGIDVFLQFYAKDIEVVVKDYQVIVRKIGSGSQLYNYDIAPEGTIPILMIFDHNTNAVIKSIIQHCSNPARLRFILIDCGLHLRDIDPRVAVTWIDQARPCGPSMSLLSVFDHCPSIHRHYIYLSSSVIRFTGDITRLWVHAPALASMAAFARADVTDEFEIDVAVVNQAHFSAQTRVVALMHETGKLKTTSPWSASYFSFAELPSRLNGLVVI